jgi:putative membrane protein
MKNQRRHFMKRLNFKGFGFLPVLFFLILLYPLTAAQAQYGRYGNWQMGPGTMGSWGMGWFGGIFMIVFWILILVGLVFVIRWLIQATGKKGDSIQHGSRAMEILKERYARGEIDKAQFEAMKRDLAD